jgi:hypothetical protein
VKWRHVRRPHSLHTAEATGSKPVTPTSTNVLLEPCGDACCQQIASKLQVVVAVALRALLRLGVLGTSMATGENPAIAEVMWGSNPVLCCSTIPRRDGGQPFNLRSALAERDRSCPLETSSS